MARKRGGQYNANDAQIARANAGYAANNPPAAPARDPLADEYRSIMAKTVTKSEEQKNRDKAAADALAGKPSTNGILSGTEAEQAGQVAGLNLGTIGYGQGLSQTGEDIQRVRDLQRARTEQSGGDPVSAAIMGQKATEQANAARGMAQSGVKGGAAAGAISAIGRQKDADIAASLYGQQKQSIADERSLAGNTLSGITSLMQGEKAANVALPSAPSQSGSSSFICTVLRSKGLMTGKEAFIMTKFMIKGLITRADFLFWYFQHGKAAVDRAEEVGFDWSVIKHLFVDDIITLINEGKSVEAQNMYIERTGTFCEAYGAKGYSPKLAKRKMMAALYFPRLFAIKVCREWLTANRKNVFKLLRA